MDEDFSSAEAEFGMFSRDTSVSVVHLGTSLFDIVLYKSTDCINSQF